MGFKLTKLDFINSFIIFILSFIFVSDLFLVKGQPQTFDAPAHITTIAQFGEILKQGEFPIIWVDKFANYGYPLGLFAHQLTAYLGGFINIFVNNPILSYNLLFFLATFLATLFFYLFLRLYFSGKTSLIAVTFFLFSAYRIINTYIRGALPEYFSFSFFILALFSLSLLFKQRKYFFSLVFIFSITASLLLHPMMFIFYGPLIFFYFCLIWRENKFSKKDLLLLITLFLLSFTLAVFYLLPLKLENKYFVRTSTVSSINNDQFLTIANYFSSVWFYFLGHPGPRGNFIQFGLMETIICLCSLILFFLLKKGHKEKQNLFYFSFISFVVLLFFTLSPSLFLYKLPFLREIQYPWRVLGVMILPATIFLAFYLEKLKHNLIYLLVLFLILLIRVPQIYTKNVVNFPLTRYYFTAYNLHTNDLTLNWIGDPSEYPSKTQKVEIIEGQGEIKNLKVENSSRIFKVQALTDLRMIDNTFYFPGWTVYIDGIKTNIEYQDPTYRGMITYKVSAGDHDVKVIFENTKIRLFSQLISLAALCLLVPIFIFRKKVMKFFALS
ncbi:hypothetical protein GYA19_02495 [Candidatus Beckwithbacteria bacterium]|nr:hypothetical protein [Candidatus Beckwithbacteria bacterium]